MIISIKCDNHTTCFDGDEYIVDLDRKFDGYENGDLICSCSPFDSTGSFPLTLELAIRKDGTLVFRKWTFANNMSSVYLHTDINNDNFPSSNFAATSEQIDTVNGLFSGRIKFEGLKLAIGRTMQLICPIDVKKEEQLIGKKIYLA